MGIFSRFFTKDSLIFALFLITFICAFSIFFILTKEKIYKISIFLSLVFILGFVRADFASLSKSQFNNLNKTYSDFYGIVVSPPKITDKGMKMEVEVYKVGNTAISEKEKILVSYDGYEYFKYGDELKIGGALEVPKSFKNENGKEFNYPMYLAKDGIFFIMQKAKIEKISENKGNRILTFLFDVKNVFISKIQKVLNTSDTAIISGILLGSQDAIPKNTQEDFQKSGLTHILVLSGYNITVVGEAVSKMFNIWFSKFVSLGFGAFAVILFALLSGGGASTIRATIMALIAILGRVLGREYDALRALFLVGLMMIFLNPLTLLYDPSFHLSFLATLGMILFSNKIEIRLAFIKYKTLRDILATTIATQLLVIPYFLWSMGKVSIISFISNIFVLPIIPITMFFGFITGVFGFVSFYLSFVPGFISHILIMYITASAHFFGSIPFAVWGI